MKTPLLQKMIGWINERTSLITFFSEFLHEEIPGGTRFSYTLGSACMFLLTMQIVTGVWQLFYYVPTIDYAYTSLNYLRLQVPFGWLVHGIHYWGGTLFTIVVGLHVLRVFIWGSYKKPREMVWLIGIVLIVLTAMFMFTGPVLPWDKNGYWAGQVGIGIAGSVPIVGPMTQMILQGADKMGQMALLRIYVLHVAIIPAMVGLFVTLHLIAFRQFGESGPWDEDKRKKIGYFWPEQIFKDVLVSFLIFLLLVFLSAFFPPPFSGLADPTDTLITPKPAWSFLFLYQILKFLPGPLEPLGTAGVPLMIILLFASLPFADSNPQKNPFKRGFIILGGFTFVGMILYLTWLGYIYRSPAEAAQMEAPNRTIVDLTNKKLPDLDIPKTMALVNVDKKLTGQQLFKTLGCTECHSTTGIAGNKQGPDLVMARGNNRSHQWLSIQVIAPQLHNPRTIMPPYSDLSDQNVELLLGYLENLKPASVPLPPPKPTTAQESVDNKDVLIKYGEQLFNTQGCVQCHTIQGRPSNKSGPDLIMAIAKDKPAQDWLKVQLTAPQQHNPMSIMPSYANRLKDDQIDAMTLFLSSLATRKPTPVTKAEEQAQAAEGQGNPPSSTNGIAPQSVGLIGDREHGAILFHQSCIMCHGPRGIPNTPGFNAPRGVPALNPIDPAVKNEDAQVFAEHVDRYIQHGIPNTEGGPNMPNFGDSHALTQAQIADLESYVLYLNGVDRTKIINPGIDPKEFFFMLLGGTSIIVLLAGLFWWIPKLLKL
ncbi:MAG: cytochrome b N-terminal domain-containing protein [Candidatus Omnitrophica bacterium]|nr:cytochrome b N-terminal domain-containing protein [Candidatus Omnitrophota bacterium]